MNRRSFVVRFDHVVGDFLRTWTFGKWVLASGLIWEAGMSVYPWVLENFHGTAANGVWVVCLSVVNLGNPALLGVQNYLGPQVVHSHAEGGNAGLRSFVLRACLSFCGLVFIFSVALLIAGGWLMVRLYGEKYADNNVTLDIMAMNLVAMAASFTLARGLLALGRADVDFMINLAAIVLMFTVGLWLVKSWDVRGAAVSILLANIVLVGSKYVAFMSLSRMRSAA
jgi:O-antigen/teichoic acid export membrane protein